MKETYKLIRQLLEIERDRDRRQRVYNVVGCVLFVVMLVMLIIVGVGFD